MYLDDQQPRGVQAQALQVRGARRRPLRPRQPAEVLREQDGVLVSVPRTLTGTDSLGFSPKSSAFVYLHLINPERPAALPPPPVSP